MRPTASDTARALGRSAETVCRHYLSHGRRTGGYWIVGDVLNSPGRSLFVRLHGPECGPGASGKWTDAATGEHGDLLDLIRLASGLTSLKDAIEEARRFLSLPPPITRSIPRPPRCEGIETMLSLSTVIPNLPVVAASSAAHLAAFNLPANLTRLYIISDNDAAGRWAAARLEIRAIEMGIPSILHLVPILKDFNDDLRELGAQGFAELLAPQLAPDERAQLPPSV